MPPLCTAGYGLATGQLYFFLGAFYLFFINSVFICLATFIIVRYLRFRITRFATRAQYRKVVSYTWIIVSLTVFPSIYLAFRIVQKAIFEQNASNFVQKEFRIPNTQVVHQSFRFNHKKSSIELLLIGEELPEAKIDSLRRRMVDYNLDSNWLVVRQGLNTKKEIDFSQVKASIMEDVFRQRLNSDSSTKAVVAEKSELPELKNELTSLYPSLTTFSLSRAHFIRADPTVQDTVILFVGTFTKNPNQIEKDRLHAWLKSRTKADSVTTIILEQARKK